MNDDEKAEKTKRERERGKQIQMKYTPAILFTHLLYNKQANIAYARELMLVDKSATKIYDFFYICCCCTYTLVLFLDTQIDFYLH